MPDAHPAETAAPSTAAAAPSAAAPVSEPMRADVLALVGGLDAIVWELELSTGRCTFVDHEAERLLGHPVRRWYDEPDFWREGLLRPEDRERGAAALLPAATDPAGDAGVHQVRHADGRAVWLRHRVCAARDEASGAPRLRGVSLDVTREQAAEARRRELADVLERVADAFFALDRDWRFTYVNQRAEPLLRRRPDELLGRVLWDEFPEAVGSTFATEYHRAVRDGVPVTFTEFYAPLDRWFEVNAYPGPDGLSVYFRDVSAQRAAREALERSRADLQLALDAGGMGTWEWDIAGRRVLWSPQEERLYGLPEGTFEGTEAAYAARIHPDDRAEAWRLVEEAVARGDETHHVLHRIVRPDGEVRWLDSHGRFVVGADGRPERLVGVSVDVTERLRFQHLRERQSDMLGAVEVGVWYCDLPFDELQWDRKVKEHFWLPPEARVTIGTFYERIHPDDRERTRSAIERSIAERAPYDIEYRTVPPDDGPGAGAVRWVRAIGYTGYDRAGQPIRFDGVTVDVTPQKRAAEALAESERRYEYAARATSNAIWDWNLTNDHVRWNPGVHTVFGFAADAVEETAAWWYDHIHPDDRERVVGGIHAVIDGADGGHAWRDEYRFRRADGSHAVVVDRGYVARDADGRSVRMIGAMEDVTAQREAAAAAERARVALEEQQVELELTNQQLQDNAVELEAQAEELQATAAELEERTLDLDAERGRLARVLEQLPVGVVVVDVDGAVLSRNSALTTVLGHEPPRSADVSGYASYGGLHADGRPYAPEDYPVARALLHGETVLRELTRYRRGDGSVVTLSISAAPVRDDDGEIVCAVAAVEDVHDREAARAAAEEANRAKTQFLANMSHELRTPLNAIQGHVQLLTLELHGPITPAQQQTLDRVDRAQQHLLRLIDEILGYARLESGRVEYDLQPVRVADVLRDIRPIVEPLVLAKGLTFVEQPAHDGTDGVRVLADREKLAQVLLNLLSNAVKFTATGGTVAVGIAPPALDDGAAGATATVYVRDTGVGIPPDKLEAIFEPFVQVRNAYSPGQGGTGLGLAISRDLARGMGGELHAASEPGVGSTFTLTLPLA